MRLLGTWQQIALFEECLSYKLFLLDTKAHAKHIGKDSYVNSKKHFSVDAFLYARCAAVANGRECYEAALKNPPEMPKDVEFEALLTIAPDAYELKTGKELEYTPGCSYETYSNIEGWKAKK